MNDRIIKIKELSDTLNLSKASIYERIKPDGKYFEADFPRPVHLGQRSIGFSFNQVQAYIASRVTARPV